MTWLDHLKSLQKKGEDDPDSAFEDFNVLTRGKFRPPRGWRDMSMERKARYLEEKFPLEDQ